MRPIVLSISGWDPTAGAGAAADLGAVEAAGARGLAVLTALTEQGRGGVRRVHPRPAAEIERTATDLLAEEPVAAVKVGMIGPAESASAIARVLARVGRVPRVVDPVMTASAGGTLAPEASIRRLLAECDEITLLAPNAEEAERLCGFAVRDVEGARRAARALCAGPVRAVLVTGGHLESTGGEVTDVLFADGVWREHAAPRIPTSHGHGTGCVLSSAIAGGLACGLSLDDALARGRAVVRAALVGGDGGAVRPGRPRPHGVHVITDDAPESRVSPRALARAARAAGAQVVQLRDKSGADGARRVELASALRQELAGSAVRLVVNDRADVAHAAGADGVHLGARDLAPDAARRLLGPSLWVGATANDLATARRLDDEAIDYLGVGPVFATRTKAHPAPCLGLAGLEAIVRAVSHPVVAIGGIDARRARDVAKTGAAGIAVVSAVTRGDDPEAEIRALVERFGEI